MAMTRREVLTMISSVIASKAFANFSENDKTKRMSTDNKLPDGILTAVLTPLDRNLNAENRRLVDHMNWLLTRGNDAIALLGTTGEANSFSVDERRKILEAALEGGILPGKLLVGTGCCAITDTVALTRHAYSNGVAGILLLPPFYYKKISDLGIETYIAKLLDKMGENDLQIYLYHFPQLSGVPFTIGLVERLVSKYPRNIVGMKDSGGDWSHMEEILKSLPGFRLYTGNEKFLLSTLKAGGAGCISATANLTSPEAAAVYQAWKNGGGENEQARLSVLRDTLEAYPSIGTLKYVFAKLSGTNDWLNIRPPNVILSAEEALHIEQKLRELNYFKPF
jgi:4-hydroxy-tetrahydrodipicolinate synthase